MQELFAPPGRPPVALLKSANDYPAFRLSFGVHFPIFVPRPSTAVQESTSFPPRRPMRNGLLHVKPLRLEKGIIIFFLLLRRACAQLPVPTPVPNGFKLILVAVGPSGLVCSNHTPSLTFQEGSSTGLKERFFSI